MGQTRLRFVQHVDKAPAAFPVAGNALVSELIGDERMLIRDCPITPFLAVNTYTSDSTAPRTHGKVLNGR